MRHIASCVGLSLVLSTAAFAGDPPSKKGAAAAEKPPAPPEVKKTVDAFAGRWKMETTMTGPDGKPVKFTEKMDCTRISMGRGVSCKNTSNPPGMGPMEYTFLIGYDAETKMVHFFAIGSPGEVHDHKCNWKDDKILDCEPLTATMGGQPITETMTATWDGDRVVLKGATTTKDGAMAFDSTGKRSGGK